MAAKEDNTIQTLLNKATSPIHYDDEMEDVVMDFCEKVKNEYEGPLTSTRLLAHKIQSPQEYEALQALVLLEACVKHCGASFHHEIGKYRFLNELIKVVSPKYLGTKATDKVKAKVIQLLYVWSIGLKEELKIRDAYQMLKKQGIVKTDPDYDDTMLVPSPEPPPPPREDTLFTDEDKKKQLEKLLKSNNPADLQAANRLIKNVVKEDNDKMEKQEKRNRTLEEVSNNVRVLNEMIANYQPDKSTQDDLAIMKELHGSCQKLRPTLFRLASDTEDNEEALMNILRANDDVSRVMQSYEKIVLGNIKTSTATIDNQNATTNGTGNISSLLDIASLDFNSSNQQSTNDLFNSHLPINLNQTTDDTDLFGISTPTQLQTVPQSSSDDLSEFFSAPPMTTGPPISAGPPSGDLASIIPSLIPQTITPPVIPKLEPPPEQTNQHLSDIDKLSRDLLERTLGRKPDENFSKAKPAKPTLKQLSSQSTNKETTPKPAQPSLDLFGDFSAQPITTQHSSITTKNDFDLLSSLTGTNNVMIPSSTEALPQSSGDLVSIATTAQVPTTNVMSPSQQTPVTPLSLNDLNVPLEQVRPSTLAPLTVYDHNGLRVLFHFAQDHATPDRTDTLVAVASIMSTRPKPVPHIILQVAVPKLMKVKLQPPSATQLTAYNPITPPPPITQVLVLSNPNKKEVKMRYKLDYKFDEQTSFSETGEISGFPSSDKWGAL